MAFEQKCEKEMGLPSWIRRVNEGAKCRVVECIPPLDLSAVSSSSNSTRPSAFTIPGKQSGAQLTIFYGGTMNVYDDIPADKAKAIMLMASSGNYTSFQHNNVEDGCGSQAWRKISGINLSEQSGINSPPLSSKVTKDIPLARKHSLQCFLEKRKARVNAKARCPYKIEEAKPH